MGDKGLNWLHNRYCSVESEQPQEVWGGGRLADAKKKKRERNKQQKNPKPAKSFYKSTM